MTGYRSAAVPMQPRPLDIRHDLPAVADLLGRTRAAGGLSHPGGIQWWLRGLGQEGNEGLAAYVWASPGRATGGDAIGAFALVDGAFVAFERVDDGPTSIDVVAWLEAELRSLGRSAIEFHVAEGDPLEVALASRGYRRSGTELELLADVSREPARVGLPEGYRFGSLLDTTDDAYVAGHRAAWSDTRPSPYQRQLHDAVTAMPQFRPDLVTIAIASNGDVASYCIGWMDEQSATLEIEPLGTHRDHRRLGLAHAVVKEVQHRAWANGAKHVLVWNSPDTNVAAYGLYTGADMAPHRTLVAHRLELGPARPSASS
jgi:ribosomal protein S18 acetylase RimI-like enzyme